MQILNLDLSEKKCRKTGRLIFSKRISLNSGIKDVLIQTVSSNAHPYIVSPPHELHFLEFASQADKCVTNQLRSSLQFKRKEFLPVLQHCIMKHVGLRKQIFTQS
jgi:hypothetical protein